MHLFKKRKKDQYLKITGFMVQPDLVNHLGLDSTSKMYSENQWMRISGMVIMDKHVSSLKI